MLIGSCIFAGLAGGARPVRAADEAIEVTCFKGDRQEGHEIGTTTVTRPETAGTDCNAAYVDCEGVCIGCYYDSQRDREVCYALEGGKAKAKEGDD